MMTGVIAVRPDRLSMSPIACVLFVGRAGHCSHSNQKINESLAHEAPG